MATKDLGELGQEVEELDLTFQYFGETMRVNPLAGEIAYLRFMDRAARIEAEEGENAPEAIVAAMDFLRKLVHPDDIEEFLDLAERHRQNYEALMQAGKTIMEALTGFPSGPPADSRGGRKKTQRKSKAGSSQRVTKRRSGKGRVIEGEAAEEDPRTERALKLLEGRPDLQTIVLMARDRRLEVERERAAQLVASP